MNELNRIERIYGCVAEYLRVLSEEDSYEPSEAELAESERRFQEYRMKIKAANGIPSEAMIRLRTDYVNSARDYYSYTDFANKALNLVHDIYGVEFSAEANPYLTAKGTYAIIVEYGYPRVISASVSNLSYDTFADVFRDLHYARLHPTLVYARAKDNLILGNISLGEYIVDYLR